MELLQSHKTEICETLDPQNGVLNELRDEGVFSRRNVKRVTALERKGARQWRAKLLTFCVANQTTLLTSSLLYFRNMEWSRAIKEVDTNTLLTDKLFTAGVLNAADKNLITTATIDKNRALLNAIMHKSPSAFDKFLQALKDVGQEQIATTLEELEQAMSGKSWLPCFMSSQWHSNCYCRPCASYIDHKRHVVLRDQSSVTLKTVTQLPYNIRQRCYSIIKCDVLMIS